MHGVDEFEKAKYDMELEGKKTYISDFSTKEL